MKNPFEIENNLFRRVRHGKNLGFDEAYLDFQSESGEVLEDERDQVNFRLLTGVVFLMLCVLFVRVFVLQAVKGNEYRALAEGNKLRVQYVLAPRGLLTDRFGKVIASNAPSFELGVVTADLPLDQIKFSENLNKVAAVLGQDPLLLHDIIAQMT